jgi:hypothetical protein
MRDERMSQDPYGAVRSAATRNCRKDLMPLGTVVIRVRSRRGLRARYVKVRNDGPPGRRWILYSRWWWEKNKGPVPKGKLVIHQDGDSLNDDPKNFMLGTPGTKLVIAHTRDPKWSKEQHRRAADACGKLNRDRARINRATNFLKEYWYPVVDGMSVIFNIPFRKRKRLLEAFGADVTRYPLNGHGRKPGTAVQRALRSCGVRPVKSAELTLRRFSTYCLIEPSTRDCRGPMSASLPQIVAQLERIGVWLLAEKCAKRDARERK